MQKQAKKSPKFTIQSFKKSMGAYIEWTILFKITEAFVIHVTRLASVK